MTYATAGAPSSRSGPTSAVVVVARGALAPMVHDRLINALGPQRAADVLHDAYLRFGNRLIETPQDMLEFAGILVQLGGLIQAVGRSLKVQALLRGAVDR
jgi:hypothetical protein